MVQSVMTFNGLNFTEWHEQVQFALGSMNFEDAILTEKPAALNDKIRVEEKALMAGWEKQNRMALMFLKMTVASNVKILLPTTDSAKDFTESVKAQSQSADKSVASTLMSKLTTMKYDGSVTMHQHILEMTSLSSKLKGVGMTVEEPFLVQFIINSLPFDQYGPFQMNYNTLKDKWTVHELSGMLIQEEQRIKDNKTPTVYLVNHNGASTSGIKKSGGGKGKKGSTTHKASKGIFKKTSKERCNFCRKVGHFQKDCMKRRQWFEKKGMNSVLVCFESHFIDVPNNTWWFDSGSSTHISILIYVVLLTSPPLVKIDISSPLSMITHVTDLFTFCMKSLNQLTLSKFLSLRLKGNLTVK